METDILQRLTAATTDAERDAIVLEMSLSALAPEMQEAVATAAVPHWFDALFLEALLPDEESDVLYGQLLGLNFVEQVPGRGYAIHERTRRQVLHNLWRDDPARFRVLSGRAADYCQTRVAQSDDPVWEGEALYHRLVSDPQAGVDGLRRLATKWANYEYHTYEEIERAVRWANEQIDAGRLRGVGADWTRLWQAKLALLYGRADRAAPPLAQITVDPERDPGLAAEVAQTRGDMLAKQEDRAGMEASWRTAYDRFRQLGNGQGDLDAYLVAEKMRRHGVPDPEPVADGDDEAPRPPTREALRLIDNISTAWIDGVLQQALAQTIDLRMARSEGQLSNLVLHRPQEMDRPLGSGQRLSRLFEAAERSLLILGAPGSGKTITLLQLLDELLQQARTDGDAPIPLLFNLSSFGQYAQEKGPDLAGWLAEQAYDQYRLKRQTTRARLAAGDRFVLLLDGLDEVPEKDGGREQCVAAINQFMQASPCGLVVCSRIGDYEALRNRLALAHALVLQPLSDRQIEAFIRRSDSPHREAMGQRVQADWQLREALRSPLLLNLLPQAFAALPDAPDRGDAASSENSVAARREALFAAYVDSIFASPEQEATTDKDSEGAKAEESRQWLAFLANRMQQAGKSLFFVEEMQPTWLPQQLQRRYRALYGLIVGLIGGLGLGLSVGLIFGLIGGLIDGLGFGLAPAVALWLTSGIRRSWLRVGIGSLVVWLIGGLSFGLIDGLFDGLIFGLIFGVGMIVSVAIATLASDIQLRERVKFILPSWQRIVKYLARGILWGSIVGLIVGLIFGLIFGLIVGLSEGLSGGLIFGLSEGSISGLIVGLIGGLIFGLIGVLIGGLSGGMLAFLDTPPVDERPIPGEGIRASIRNAFLMTTLAALFFGLPALLIDRWLNGDLFILALVLPNILPPTFTWFGGLAWSQHWALRFILARQGKLPVRLVPWLDEMAARGLLRRVGGGYIFIHRSLLEYFATLAEG